MSRIFIGIFSLFLTVNFSFTSSAVKKQGYETGWDSSVLAKANTAANDTFLTVTEKQVVYYINLARMDPKKFGETILPMYMKNSGEKENSYSKSLARDLKKAKPMSALTSGYDLFLSAREHAIKSGKKGTVGHQELSKRIKKYAPLRKTYGENCDYGRDEAMDIVMSWLIDEGISDLAHRKNILDADYTAAGISIQPHKKYGVNAVMDYGK